MSGFGKQMWALDRPQNERNATNLIHLAQRNT
jgi:hypothetical protein